MRPLRLPLTSVLAAALLLTGCAGPAPRIERRLEKTGTATQQAGVAAPAAPAYPSPRAGSGYDDPSTGMAFVASAVPGAGAVSAVALGNVALLGVSTTDPGVHKKVAEQIMASFPHIADVRIVTDPAAIPRITEADNLLRVRQSILPLLPELAARAGASPAIQ